MVSAARVENNARGDAGVKYGSVFHVWQGIANPGIESVSAWSFWLSPVRRRPEVEGRRADMWGPIVGQRRRGRGGSVRNWAKVASWVVLGQQAESAGELFLFFLYSIFLFI